MTRTINFNSDGHAAIAFAVTEDSVVDSFVSDRTGATTSEARGYITSDLINPAEGNQDNSIDDRLIVICDSGAFGQKMPRGNYLFQPSLSGAAVLCQLNLSAETDL